MPIQASQWADYLSCPACGREFGELSRSPISIRCGHTVCRQCLSQLNFNQCPLDQTPIHSEEEELVVNTALLQLTGVTPPPRPYHPPSVQALPVDEQNAYDVIVQCMEELASYIRNAGNNNNDAGWSGRPMSRSIQRKLVALVQCSITDVEGRGRAARTARSLAERTVNEMILQYQNSQQLTVNLWAAVRARGCQFLGPAMQEEVLKLVLLALEDGTALSRKVLVMFVVQRLEPDFPQASKTSIGHVVQLLYRASCFKVSKRESDSSLMQLRDDFRTYDSLRREHDAQIVQIATESGLRIAPDQWSSLLYGDTHHKSHMQSIIDKLQSPQLLVQSIKELVYTLHRIGEQGRLLRLNQHLDMLIAVDARPDSKNPSLPTLAENLTALKEVVSGLLQYEPLSVNQETNEQATNGIDMPEAANDNAQYEHLASASDVPDYHRLSGAMSVPPPAPYNPLVPPPAVPYVVLNEQRYTAPPPNIGVSVLTRQMVSHQIAPNQSHLNPLPQPPSRGPAQAPMQAYYPYPIPNMPSVPAFVPVMPGVQYNWRGTNYQPQTQQVSLRVNNSQQQSLMPFAQTHQQSESRMPFAQPRPQSESRILFVQAQKPSVSRMPFAQSQQQRESRMPFAQQSKQSGESRMPFAQAQSASHSPFAQAQKPSASRVMPFAQLQQQSEPRTGDVPCTDNAALPPLNYYVPPPPPEWCDPPQQAVEDEASALPRASIRLARLLPSSIMDDVELEEKIEEVKLVLAGVIASPER